MKKILMFKTFQEAFDYTREANHPVVCVVREKKGWRKVKLYPSGTCKYL